jgi:hypothetical protein
MESEMLDLDRPTVIKVKNKKKKRRYSRGLKGVQVVGRRMTKMSSKSMRAVSRGMKAFRKANDKSARKSRDGGLRDLNLNLAKGFSRTLREASDLPYDMAKSLRTRNTRRIVRLQIRAASRLSRALRFR